MLTPGFDTELMKTIEVFIKNFTFSSEMNIMEFKKRLIEYLLQLDISDLQLASVFELFNSSNFESMFGKTPTIPLTYIIKAIC